MKKFSGWGRELDLLFLTLNWDLETFADPLLVFIKITSSSFSGFSISGGAEVKEIDVISGCDPAELGLRIFCENRPQPPSALTSGERRTERNHAARSSKSSSSAAGTWIELITAKNKLIAR